MHSWFSRLPPVFSKYMTLSCLNVSGLLSRTVAEKHLFTYSLQFSHRLLNCLLFSPFLWEMPWYIGNPSILLQGYGNSVDELQKDFLETYGLCWDCQRQSLLESKHRVFWTLTTASLDVLGTYCHGDHMISDGITTPPSARVEDRVASSMIWLGVGWLGLLVQCQTWIMELHLASPGLRLAGGYPPFHRLPWCWLEVEDGFWGSNVSTFEHSDIYKGLKFVLKPITGVTADGGVPYYQHFCSLSTLSLHSSW